MKNDRLFTVGLGLWIACSIYFFVSSEGMETWRRNFFSDKFLLIYVVLAGYFIAVLIDNKKETGKLFRFYSLPHNIALLLLGNISAYALNLEFRMFEESTAWLTAFLVVLNIVFAVLGIRRKFEPDAWNYFTVAVLSAGALLQLYQTLYLLPVMAIGTLAFWFFGISLHAFLPLWFLILSVKLIMRFLKTSESYRSSLIAGGAIPLALVIGFVIHWNNVSREIGNVYRESLAQIEKDGLPEWVKAGQRFGEDWMTKRILNCETRGEFFSFGSGVFFSDGEKHWHDPLITIASLFVSERRLPWHQQQRLSQALLQSRHKTEPRLWSGNKLRTEDVVTNVQFFPEYRMAYTEKTFTIENTGWPNLQQEAIYSFYLPEGAVVTSAALWINGKEEPAYLTTKSKAEQAYTTIVGRERRDPLLVTWQEGNRVTARIFPCTPEENRQFKIGITSPLWFKDGLLFYENIDFDGPSKEAAVETIQILKDQGLPNLITSFKFKPKGNLLHYSGRYQRDWQLSMEAPLLNEVVFTHNGRSFKAVPLPEIVEPFVCREIYLDINDGWTKKQFDALWPKIKDLRVYAWDSGMVQLTEQNKYRVFKDLSRLKFSLFPFHKISGPDEALVITQDAGLTPLPKDLEQSQFADGLSIFFNENTQPLKVLNIGQTVSPYIGALREMRGLHVHAASLEEVLKLAETRQFPAWQEDSENVAIGQSGMKIRQLPAESGGGNAPDHLLRLFAYNDLMKAAGKSYFNKKDLEESLAAQAEEAYIVTPVSSLVTLETQEDYDRFNIEKPGENSLKNASIKSSGAVPEPHEWLLIALCLTVAVWLFGIRKQA